MRKYYIYILLATLLIGCNEEGEFPTQEYARLATKEVTSNGGRFVFTGEVIAEGTTSITELGFVWDTNSRPRVQTGEIIRVSVNNTNEFFAQLSNSNVPDSRQYFVRAFLRNGDFLVYGESQSFRLP